MWHELSVKNYKHRIIEPFSINLSCANQRFTVQVGMFFPDKLFTLSVIIIVFQLITLSYDP